MNNQLDKQETAKHYEGFIKLDSASRWVRISLNTTVTKQTVAQTGPQRSRCARLGGKAQLIMRAVTQSNQAMHSIK